MAATFEFQEDNGPQTGSPLKGTTRTAAVTQFNLKNADDAATTTYTAGTIPRGSNSFIKHQFGKFTGTFNSVSGGLWAHTAGVLGSGLTLVGKVTSTYATPTTAAMSGSTDMTSVIAIGSGQTVLFSTTGPEGGSTNATLSAAGYSQYLVAQLQVASGATLGDTASYSLALRYDEN